MELTPQQKAAVEHLGTPALVVAGAGSGKTRTLTQKIDYLISKGYPSENILAITFTNKAADEMKHRLQRLTGLTLDRFPWVRTYHSACFKIFKEHCRLLNFEPPVQIFGDYHQRKMIKEIGLRLNIDKKHLPDITAHISKAKNSGNPEEYFDHVRHKFPVQLHDIYKLYEKELFDQNGVDFDNILFLTRNILRDHASVRQYYQNLFHYILVDEYQDSNNIQEEVTRLLLGSGNLFCVGDDWQAVYGFRGSNVNHFLSFSQNYKDAKLFRLEQNFRSANEIVELANNLIAHNKHKIDKKCFSAKKGGSIEIQTLYNETDEANWVAGKVQILNRKGISYDDMAVMYRTRFCSLAFEKAFRMHQIPHRMLGSKGFFERKEILDLNCYLAASVFPKDDTSFERIVNLPKRGIGPGTIKKINSIRQEGMSLQDSFRKAVIDRILSPKLYNGISALIALLDDVKTLPPMQALEEIIDRIDYMAHLKQYTKAGDMDLTARKENITELLYAAAQKNTISEYLEEAALIREDHEDDDEDQKEHGVALSTIHASKGLEYHAAFLVGCEEELFPHFRSMYHEESLQEERRLMYVAITRAESYLYISGSSYRRGEARERSRFVDEVEVSLMN